MEHLATGRPATIVERLDDLVLGRDQVRAGDGPAQFETTIEPALPVGRTGASPAAAANLLATAVERWAITRPEQLFWPGGLVVRDRSCQSMPSSTGIAAPPANN